MKVYLYIHREYIKFLVLSLSVFTLLYLIIQITDMLGVLNRGNATGRESLTFFASGIPSALTYIIPLSALIATNLVFIFMNRHREILALKSAGLNPKLLFIPLLPSSILLSILLFYNDNFLAPAALYRRNEILERVKFKKRITRGEKGKWFYSGSKFLRIGEIDSGSELVSGVTIFRIGEDFQPKERFDADIGVWKSAGIWRLKNVTNVIMGNRGELKVRYYKSLDIEIGEKPSSLSLLTGVPSELSFQTLKRLMRSRKEAGLPFLKERVVYNSRFSYPLLCILLPFLAFPFAIHAGERPALPLLYGTLIGLSAFLLFTLGLVLGKGGIVPPFMSAWVSNIAFFVIGAINFNRQR